LDRAAKLRLAACVILGLGAALLMAALLLGVYTVNKVAKIPLNIDTTLTSEGNGQALNAKYLNPPEPPKPPEGEPEPPRQQPKVVIDDVKDQHLVQQQQITSESGHDRPSNDNEVTVQMGTTLRRIDIGDAGLLLAMIDTVTLNRTTATAVQGDGPNGWLAKPRDLTVPAKPDASDPQPVKHQGLSYRFPIDVSKDGSYEYFDPIAQKPFKTTFKDTEDVLGLETYHFTQSVGLDAGGNLPKKPSSDVVQPVEYQSRFADPTVDSKITARAAEWGFDNEPADKRITMTRYYAAFRDFWVDPVTGIIVKEKDQAFHYFVRCDDGDVCKEKNPLDPEKIRTLVKYSIESTQDTVESQLNAARDQGDQIALVGRILPITFTALGIVALVGGALLGLFTLRAQTALIDPGLDTAGHEFLGPRGSSGERRPPGAEAETEKLPTQRRSPREPPSQAPPPP
jgi:hypothetical protein